MEFDRSFTHLCVFPFSGRGKQAKRERGGERVRERREGGVVEKGKRRGGEVTKAPE